MRPNIDPLGQQGATYQQCPACGYADALAVTVRDGKDLFHCHAGCDQTDLLRAIRNRAAGTSLAQPLGVARQRQAQARITTPPPSATYVQQLWQQSQAGFGSLAQTYLASRGLRFTPENWPSDLRFLSNHPHKPSGTSWPIMLAAVRGLDGGLLAVHRTYLAPDGSGKAPVTPAKMTLGSVGGHAVQLAPAATKLAIAEGIETALSVMLASAIPCWSAVSAGGIRNLILPPLPLASDVTIAADPDPAGLNAAQTAAQRWLAEGRTVRIATPPLGQDFNDLIREPL
jgi:hypothetical protein